MTVHPPLALSDVGVTFGTAPTSTQVVRNVDLTLAAGQTVGLVGESGSGKSTLALTATGYPLPDARRTGTAALAGTNLLQLNRRQLSNIWGRRIAYVPQNAATALDPRLTIADQIIEPIRLHRRLAARKARREAVDLLDEVGIPQPDRALRRHTHEFSGGQQQRIAVAIAISCHPDVLLLDEPTTGLDTTTQVRINSLIKRLVTDHALSTLYISHNLGLLYEVSDQIAVMYAGEIIEQGPTEQVLTRPCHPYTAALISAVPALDQQRMPRGLPGTPPPAAVSDRCAFTDRCEFRAHECEAPVRLRAIGEHHTTRCIRTDAWTEDTPAHEPKQPPSANTGRPPVLEINEVSFSRTQHRRAAFELGPLSLRVHRGETLGIAGESGSGKSTLLKVAAGLIAPSSGTVRWNTEPLPKSARNRSRAARKAVQLVFQNPDSSLNPMHAVQELIARPIELLRPELSALDRADTVHNIAARVQLPESTLGRRPTELSGGQQQRVAIARALAADPEVLLCDEITSALDVSVQASILELLAELREERGVAIVLVTHDWGVLRALTDHVAVMRNGAIVEAGPTHQIIDHPSDAYTQEMLHAVPRLPRRGHASDLEARA